jgi:hypothetical protein
VRYPITMTKLIFLMCLGLSVENVKENAARGQELGQWDLDRYNFEPKRRIWYC